MPAITSSKEGMFVKMDSVAIEVGLLRADFRTMLERVTMDEGHFSEFLQEVDLLKKTVATPRYVLMFPARLRVQYEGNAYFFESPEDAKDWIDALGGAKQRTPTVICGSQLLAQTPDHCEARLLLKHVRGQNKLDG
ncbi:hypothetical protein NDU88_012105 [Pleurodeles waltl]|uniref:PH domain-containing protein n=1 Tax=Pleurodeles waltl TaxID=8319 RepID=A0AAV7QZ72_PLEWA|nr:hypothetical protein NDU88_012105 [Pleurodeles waltl]